MPESFGKKSLPSNNSTIQRRLIMEEKKSTAQDIENVLREIGEKLEELVKKGAEAGLEAKEEIEKKIQDLKENKTTLEEEFRKGKDILEREFQEKKTEFEPKYQESKGFFKEGLRQLGLAFKTLFGNK